MAYRALITLLEGQRLVTLPISYNLGTNGLLVSLNGQALVPNSDYTEISINQIFLSDPAKAGELLEARIFGTE